MGQQSGQSTHQLILRSAGDGTARAQGEDTRATGTAEETHAKVAGFIVLFGPAAASGQQTDLSAGKEAGVGQGLGTPCEFQGRV